MKKWWLILIKVIVGLVVMALLTGCNNAKYLPENKYLLVNNDIETNNPEIDESDISSFIKQKPNKKILGFYRFHLSVYTVGSWISKDNWLKKFLTDNIGEKPVVLDTSLTNNSVRQIKYYLENQGYFNSLVEKSIEFKDNKKAKVTYRINASKPYKIRKLKYRVEDSSLLETIKSTRKNSLLKSGKRFDADRFDDERERITEKLKNKGYYYFNKNYIRFKIDSSLPGRKLDVYVQVDNRVYEAKMYDDSLVSLLHHKYKVKNVYIYPDYNALKQDSVEYDTLKYHSGGSTYNYLYEKKLPYKPKTLERFIFIESGELYNFNDVKLTNHRLGDLQQFKYINIEFEDLHAGIKPWFRDTMPNTMDCHIRLTRDARRHYTVEGLVKNTSRDMGTELSLIYGDKNLFRGAEQFDLSTNLALETQRIIGEEEDETIANWLPFNTVEAGLNTSLEFPKFLLPFVDQSRFPHYFKPHTNLNAGYNYRERPDFRRHLINFSFGYTWDESETKQHRIYLPNINSIKMYPDSIFLRKLNEIDNKKFINAYEDHLIVGAKYTFILNTQAQRKSNPTFWYFRGDLELAGNALNLLSKGFNARQDDEGYYELFKIRYAQYVRASSDFRYYYRFAQDNTLAGRIDLGLGIPYGNLNVLPFEKSFFVGGANGIRAWPIRSLGPGGFSGSVNNFDKIGDISFESSLEYRFPIYDFVKGALFLDAGNVWLKDENDDFPDGEFKFDRFYKEIAMGTGLGLRLNFSVFVIRIDAGIKMSDPSLPEGDRWVLAQYKLKHTNLNFGIGYPF